jgi:hypothetical protein
MPLHLFKTLIRGYLFWPLVMVALAMVLAVITANGDDYLAGQDEIADALTVLRLSNDDARAVLSTVASAAITVLSLVYSMTWLCSRLPPARSATASFAPSVTTGLAKSRLVFWQAPSSSRWPRFISPTRSAAADIDRRCGRFGDRVGHFANRLRQQCFPPHPDRQ